MCVTWNDTDCEIWEPCSVVDCSNYTDFMRFKDGGNGTDNGTDIDPEEDFMCVTWNETDCEIWEPCSIVDCSNQTDFMRFKDGGNGTDNETDPNAEPEEEFICVAWNGNDCEIWEPCSVVDCSAVNETEGNNDTDPCDGNPGGEIWELQCGEEEDGS